MFLGPQLYHLQYILRSPCFLLLLPDLPEVAVVICFVEVGLLFQYKLSSCLLLLEYLVLVLLSHDLVVFVYEIRVF
jgi:hypothetical protein